MNAFAMTPILELAMQYTLEHFYNEGATMLEAGINVRKIINMSVRNSRGRLRKSLEHVK